MAGLGAAINTGNVGRGKSVAVIGCGGVGVAAIAGSALAGAVADHRGRHRRPEARAGHEAWAPPTRSNSKETDPVEAIQELAPDGTGRGGRRRDRRRRPPRDLEAGVLRPRPGRHRRPGRRADAGHEDPRHPADRRLRPRRLAQVQLVRRLPARRATSRCWSTSTSRAGSTSTRSSPRRSASATSRPPSTRCTTATCCARSWSLMTARVDHAVVSGTFTLDGETHDVDNNVWVVGDDDECVVIDAPHDVDAILARRRRAARSRRSCCTHAHDDHVRVAPALRRRDAVRRSCCTPTTGRCGSSPTAATRRAELWDVDLADGHDARRRRRRADGAAHARPRARARSASTSTTSAASSPATPSSRAAPARPGARSATPT